MGNAILIIIAAVAGLVAGVLSNWIYDLLRSRGHLSDNPTKRYTIIALSFFLVLIVVSVLPSLLDLDRSSAVPALYQVRVLDAENQKGVPNAQVTLESTGVPQVVYTDTNGLAIIQLSEIGNLTIGRLIIDAPTYQTHFEQIDFSANSAEVKTIQLHRSE